MGTGSSPQLEIVGKVLLDGGGPLAGAQVSAYPRRLEKELAGLDLPPMAGAIATTTSTAGGSYRLGLPEREFYLVTASHPAGVTRATTNHLGSSSSAPLQGPTLVTLDLTLARPPLVVSSASTLIIKFRDPGERRLSAPLAPRTS